MSILPAPSPTAAHAIDGPRSSSASVLAGAARTDRDAAPRRRSDVDGGLRPTIHYEDAAQARRTTGSPSRPAARRRCRSPRAAATAGRSTAARRSALPAGRQSGTAMRATSPWRGATAAPAVPDDRPIVDPAHDRPRPSALTLARHRDPDVRPRRGRRSRGAPPRGLRVPPVLGADRRLHAARLGEDLDRRLLRGRRRQQGQPHPQEHGRRPPPSAGAAGRARA